MKRIVELYKRLDFVTFLKILILDGTRRVIFPAAKLYHSQYGEDVFAYYLLQDSTSRFYVEVGANEPIKHSNTFKFYLRGWHGILVDGNPAIVKKSAKIRKKDTVLHEFVSNDEAEIKFYISDDTLLSSSDKDMATKNNTTNRVVETITVKPKTLTEILDINLMAGQKIDLLSIDVEGNDYNVLLSLDFNKYRPDLIIIEDFKHNKLLLDEHPYNKYLTGKNYKLISTDIQNLIFADITFLKSRIIL